MAVMRLYCRKVYGLGIAWELVSTAHDDNPLSIWRREVYVKIFLGPVLVLFDFPVTTWRRSRP